MDDKKTKWMAWLGCALLGLMMILAMYIRWCKKHKSKNTKSSDKKKKNTSETSSLINSDTVIKIDSQQKCNAISGDERQDADLILRNSDEKKSDNTDYGSAINANKHFGRKNSEYKTKLRDKPVIDFDICNIAYDIQVQTLIREKYGNIGQLWEYNPTNLLQFGFLPYITFGILY